MSRNKLADKILKMAEMRGPDKTICPSEVARDLYPTDWRKHMQEVRDEAIILEQHGKVVITQQGDRIDPEELKGPIRIRIVPGK